MLSLCRSLARPSKRILIVAKKNRTTLILSAQASSQDVSNIKPGAGSGEDLLREDINNCRSMKQLKDVVQQHLHHMDNVHLIRCMWRYECLKSTIKRSDFLPAHDPLFEKLSRRILLRLSSFDAKDCVELASLAEKLKLHSSSPLVQGVCQSLEDRLNELNFSEITALWRAIGMLRGTSVLTETIRLSLPRVFSVRVEQRLDPSDKNMCLSAMISALNLNVDQRTQGMIASVVQNFISEITPEDAADVLCESAVLGPSVEVQKSPKMRKLFGKCLSIVARDLSTIDVKSFWKILNAYTQVKTYNEELENALWSWAPVLKLREVSSLVRMSLGTKSFTKKKAEYLKYWLLNHQVEPTVETSYENCAVCCYVMALLAAQSPERDGSFEELGLSFAEVLERDTTVQKRPDVFLNFLLNLAILGTFPKRQLDVLFSDDFQKKMWSFSSAQFDRLFNLERCLRLYYGHRCAYEVMPELREFAEKQQTPPFFDFELVEKLQIAFGGDQYLLKRLTTPLGVRVNFAIVLKQGVYPIALAGKRESLEDLPKDCKALAILRGIPKITHFENAPDMKTISFALTERFLRVQNICPVVFGMNEWRSLSENEKIPSIARTIREALKEDRTYQQNSDVSFVSSEMCPNGVPRSRSEVSSAEDPVLNNIHDSFTMEQLQTVVQQCLEMMNKKHMIECLWRYCQLNEGRGSPRIDDDRSFEKLAERILQEVDTFDTQDLVQLARFTGKLKLDSYSSLVRGILQRLRNQLNEFEVDHIRRLWFAICQFKGTSLLKETFKSSLPVVFETCVKQRLDPSNRNMCFDALRLAAAMDVDEQTQDILLKAAQKFIAEIPAGVAAGVLYNNASREPRIEDKTTPGMRNFFAQCQSIVARSLLTSNDVSVRRVLKAYLRSKTYNKELEDALWSMAPAATLSEASVLIRMSVAMSSLTVKRAESLKYWLLEHTRELTKETSCENIAICCHAMALLAAQSPEPDGSMRKLGRSFAGFLGRATWIQRRPAKLLNFLLDLAVLGVYPERELDLLFSEDYQMEMMCYFVPQFDRLFHLERCLRLYFGDQCEYEVKPELRELAKKRQPPSFLDEGLMKTLHTMLGGEQFLLKRLKTPLGVDADLAIVIDEGESPMALADKQDPLEDLPEKCKVLAILQTAEKITHFENAPDTKKISFALRERFLRAQNIFPVTIRLTDWHNLPHNERIPHITEAIKGGLRESRAFKRENSEEFQ